MRHFLRIAQGVDVGPLAQSLFRQPDLWNADRIRTTFDRSPHAEADDILLRFEDSTGLDRQAKGFDRQLEKRERIWQPAWFALPQAKPILPPLMHAVGAYELSRVIITRLTPGKRITPHADVRGAYANLPDIARYHVVIQGEPGSLFHCGDETVNMRTGEVWQFDAHSVHAVENHSADDRLHMLVDMRLMA